MKIHICESFVARVKKQPCLRLTLDQSFSVVNVGSILHLRHQVNAINYLVGQKTSRTLSTEERELQLQIYRW